MSPVPFALVAIANNVEALQGIAAVAAGIADIGVGVILRDPLHRPEHVRALAREALRIRWPQGVTLIANSVATEGVPGLHLTASQIAVPGGAIAEGGARRLPGTAVIGASVHSLAELEQARQSGVAYVLAGPVFPTPSKPGHAGIGVRLLASIVAAAQCPVFALGGIDAANIAGVFRAGAFGVAGVSLFQPEHSAGLAAVCAAIRARRGGQANDSMVPQSRSAAEGGR